MTLPYPTRTIVTTDPLSGDADVFPVLRGADFLLAKSPQWSTGLKRAASGREIRVGYWSAPIYNFSVRHNVLNDKVAMLEAQRIVAFFNSRQGRYGCFYFQDPDDTAVTNAAFGTGDGSTTAFQLQRPLALGMTQVINEPIYALWKTPTIKVSGSSTGAYTLNTTGQVTFTSPPAVAAPLTWTGNFLYLCRFDQDTLDMEQLVHLLWSQKGLTFCTVKP